MDANFVSAKEGKMKSSTNVADLRQEVAELERRVGSLQEALDQRESNDAMLLAVHRVQSNFISSSEATEVFDALLEELLNLTQSPFGFVGEVLVDEQGQKSFKAHAISHDKNDQQSCSFLRECAPPGLEFKQLNNLFGIGITTGRPIISNNPMYDPRRGGFPEGHPELRSFLGIPIFKRDELLGLLGVANRLGGYNAGHVEYLQPFLSTAANVIHAWRIEHQRGVAFAELRESEQRFRQMAESVQEVFWIKSVDQSQMLYLSPGFESVFGQNRNDLENDPNVWINWVHDEDRSFVSGALPQMLTGDYDQLYRAISLTGEHKWVHERAFPVKDETGEIYRIAGIATDVTHIKKAEEDIRLAHLRMVEAYDTTLAGWSRALDIRDRETEGHSQRVADLTVKLARKFGFAGEELEHIRRGSILHDIGKMAVPDSILLKPGELTEDEWVIMRRHTEVAREVLEPIEFLRPALDIPLYHHEWFDGSGYPYGLSQEEIPLTARIFAIVDVWDALHSDRPYRDAWPTEKVIDHIEKLAGAQFDPMVVLRFLDMVATEL